MGPPRAQINGIGMQYGDTAMMSEQQREAQKAAWRDPAIRAQRTETIRAARRQAGRAANPQSTNGANGTRAKSPTLRLRPKALQKRDGSVKERDELAAKMTHAQIA